VLFFFFFFFFQAEDGIRDYKVTGVQTCALPISTNTPPSGRVLVMPFENVTHDGRIIWMGEAAAVLLADDLNAFGVSAITRDERRSEERRVGKECRSRWWREHEKKKIYESV